MRTLGKVALGIAGVYVAGVVVGCVTSPPTSRKAAVVSYDANGHAVVTGERTFNMGMFKERLAWPLVVGYFGLLEAINLYDMARRKLFPPKRAVLPPGTVPVR